MPTASPSPIVAPPGTPPASRTVVRAFEDAGALSPATARPLDEIAHGDWASVVALVARRVVREGAPGRYYLHAGTAHARRSRLVTALAVLAVLALLPVLLLQITR